MNNEPVAWMREDGVIAFHKQKEVDSQGFKWIPLYTHPANLTDELKKMQDRLAHLEKMIVWYQDITMTGINSTDYENGFWDAVTFVKHHQVKDKN